MTNGKDSGKVNIHGREYQTVALRVSNFREKHPLFTLQTEIISRDEQTVVMKASILDESGRVIATGHAEERRNASTINKTSALENGETSAIGRALAAFGMGGTEFATADEVANAIAQQKGVHKPVDGAFEGLSKARQQVVMDTAIMIRDKLQENLDFDAYGLCEHFTDADEKVALWSLLDSKQRSRIKKQTVTEPAPSQANPTERPTQPAGDAAKISLEQAMDLAQALSELDPKAEAAFLKIAKLKRLDDLPTTDYQKALDWVNRRKKLKNEAAQQA